MTEGHGEKRKLGPVQLKVDGKTVPMKGFVQDFVGSAIIGMLSTLKGTGHPQEIEIKIQVR